MPRTLRMAASNRCGQGRIQDPGRSPQVAFAFPAFDSDTFVHRSSNRGCRVFSTNASRDRLPRQFGLFGNFRGSRKASCSTSSRSWHSRFRARFLVRNLRAGSVQVSAYVGHQCVRSRDFLAPSVTPSCVGYACPHCRHLRVSLPAKSSGPVRNLLCDPLPLQPHC